MSENTIPTTVTHKSGVVTSTRQRSYRELIGGFWDHGHVPIETEEGYLVTGLQTIQPVRNEPLDIEIRRDQYGDWRISMISEHGNTSGNFGPTVANMLAGLFDYLHGNNGGNWSAFENETPR
jgi:hypothetical protein